MDAGDPIWCCPRCGQLRLIGVAHFDHCGGFSLHPAAHRAEHLLAEIETWLRSPEGVERAWLAAQNRLF